MSRYSIDLSQFDDDFRAEEIEERGDFEEVPDGKYQVRVEKVELTEAQSTGNPMIKWTLRIIAPRCINRVLFRHSVIKQNTLRYIKTDLHLCGLDLERLSDLPRHLDRLLDIKLEVTKRTKNDNTSIYFDRRIDTKRKAQNFRREADDAIVPF